LFGSFLDGVPVIKISKKAGGGVVVILMTLLIFPVFPYFSSVSLRPRRIVAIRSRDVASRKAEVRRIVRLTRCVLAGVEECCRNFAEGVMVDDDDDDACCSMCCSNDGGGEYEVEKNACLLTD